MKLLSKLGGEVKALGAELKSRPFSAYGGNAYGGAGYSGGALPGYGMPFSGGLPGSQYDDHAAAGVLWENPAAAACFVALTKAFAQARPYLEKRVKPDSNEWRRCDHPLIELLERPNAYYSGEKMFGVTLVCAMSQGAAFWRFERDRKGDVSEIWYEPPVGLGATGIAPNWDRHHFIKDFYYFVDGQRSPEPIPREDVIYFRHGLNVANPRLPWSPLGLGAREIAVLNSASSYTSAVMRNHGMPAGFVSMDGGGLTSSTPPTPEQAESLKAQIENRFGGAHNAGKTFVSSLPWKWNKVGMTPAEMVIDKIRQWPQETVCALLGTPVVVALLPTGEQPTYQNLDASMRWWWDNTIIPLEDSFADEIETQMFPAFGLDAANYRLAWDRSKIPALQEDEQAKHAMVCADFKAGVIDHDEARIALGYESKPEYHGKFAVLAKATEEGGEDVKALKSQEFRESDWVRRGGRFQHYVGGIAPHSAFVDLDKRENFDIPGKSGEEERKKVKLQNEGLDSMHEWYGDSLPEPLKPLKRETFTNALANTIRYLEVNAKEGYNEAGISVLFPSGEKVGEIVEGTQLSIRVPEPKGAFFSGMHSHPRDEGPSPKDWAKFLSNPNYVQMCIVTPTFTLMFYKPPKWHLSHSISLDKAEADINEKLDVYLTGINMEKEMALFEAGHPFVHYAFLTREICIEYDILHRIGTRSRLSGG